MFAGLVNGFQNRCKDVPPIEAFDGNLLCAGSRGFVQVIHLVYLVQGLLTFWHAVFFCVVCMMAWQKSPGSIFHCHQCEFYADMLKNNIAPCLSFGCVFITNMVS